jgi:hypothetical protein
MKRSIVLVSVLLAGALAGGAVGVIVGASTTPQLHACVQKTTNLMRYTTGTSCKSGEKLVTWNVQGPTGPTGARGATGATGPQGPAGGSGGGSAGISFYDADSGSGGLAGQGTLTTLKVPAGTYLLDWGFTGLSGVGDFLGCILTRDPNQNPLQSLPAYVSFTSVTSISLVCYTTDQVNYQHAEILATLATRLAPIP